MVKGKQRLVQHKGFIRVYPLLGMGGVADKREEN